MRHLLASVDQLLYLSGKEIQSQRSGVAFLIPLSVSGADSWLECMFSDWVSFPVSSSSLPPSAWRQQGRMFRAGSCCFLLLPMHCDSFGKSGDPWGSGRGCILTPCLTHVSIALSHLGGAPSTPRLSLPVYTKLALLFSGQELTKQGEGWYFCLFALAVKFRPCRGHSEVERILEWNVRAGEHFSRWICI